jgi:hypothetical protein
MIKLILPVFLSICSLEVSAQAAKTDTSAARADTTIANYKNQRDAIDILYYILKKDASKRVDTAKILPGKIYFSGAPAIAYQLQTGLAAVFTGSFAFYTGNPENTKISSVFADFQYTQKSQLVLPLESNIWSKNNEYNFIGDYRFLKYPEDTYGIGGYTTVNDAYTVNYNYTRFYQYVLKKISTDFYAGAGVQYDHHWNIREEGLAAGRVTDFEKYGFNTTSTSSGISLNFLYNNIKNSINPEGGLYANVILRQNIGWLGSDQNWNSALVDIRKYIPVGHKGNILAFWTYDWLTLNGNPPYLDLPSNGWDTYSNTERGYIQSRFAGKKMAYLESEYRFGITSNGLLGGVVFANAASFTQMNNRFEVIEPAAGAGVRVKFNKFSRTNVALDYAFGKGGSRGVFINLGEVF